MVLFNQSVPRKYAEAGFDEKPTGAPDLQMHNPHPDEFEGKK